MSQTKKKRLHVFIVEPHNDVLRYIHRAIAARHLPFSDITMLHFDSHPDLLLPMNLKADDVYEPKDLYQSLSIENWLLPLTYAKHVGHVIWVKPPWARQIKSSEQMFTIGKCSQSGFIRLSSKENYFLTDALFQTPEKLIDSSEVKLSVVELLPDSWSELDPGFISSDSTDPKEVTESTVQQGWLASLQDKIGLKPFILDIDLDFFSTGNPFKGILEAEEEQALARLYKCKMPTDCSEHTIMSFTEKRRKQLEELEKIFNSLESKWSDAVSIPESDEVEDMNLTDLVGLEEVTVTFNQETLEKDIKQLTLAVMQKKSSRDLTFNLLHDYGCTLDDTELPHHISTDEQMDALIAEFGVLLENLPKPGIVTIARSSEDEYCPQHQVDMLQQRVLSLIEKVYGCLDITYDYG